MKKDFQISAEEELLRARFIKRDPEALKDFTAVYGTSLYGFLRSALGQRASSAHPLLIDTLARYLSSINTAAFTEPVGVTLMRHLLKAIQKVLKDKPSQGFLEIKDPRISMLEVCLSRLSWEERVLLLLRDQMDFSLQELEAILGKPEQEIRAQLKEVRLHFREHLLQVLKAKIKIKT